MNCGPPSPSFCGGAPALSQCAACLEHSCGFTAGQTADGSLCSFAGTGSSSSSSSSSSGTACQQACAQSDPAGYMRGFTYSLEEYGCAGAAAACASPCTAECACPATLDLGSPCGQCLFWVGAAPSEASCKFKWVQIQHG
jgi:hypothetical protein